MLRAGPLWKYVELLFSRHRMNMHVLNKWEPLLINSSSEQVSDFSIKLTTASGTINGTFSSQHSVTF